MKRTYTKEEIAEALAALVANGGNVYQTSKTLNIPRKTIIQWRDGKTHKDIPRPFIEKKRRDLGDTIERLAFRLCDVTMRQVKRSSDNDVKALLIGLGIAVDKLLLLRGQATSITRSTTATATVDLSRLDRDEILRLHELHVKARGEALDEASDLSEPVIVEVVPSVEDKPTSESTNSVPQ